MRRTVAYVLFVAAGLFCAVSAAQEGYPLVGTWHGEWGLQAAERNDLTVIMNWDGQRLSGLVNPVTDRAPLLDARLNSDNWTMHFAVDVKGSTGKAMRCTADGKLDHLGSDQRTLAGQWNCGGETGSFKLTRDRDY